MQPKPKAVSFQKFDVVTQFNKQRCTVFTISKIFQEKISPMMLENSRILSKTRSITLEHYELTTRTNML